MYERSNSVSEEWVHILSSHLIRLRHWNQVHSPLGNWYTSDQNSSWEWYVNDSATFLYQQTPSNHWRQYRKLGRSYLQHRFSLHSVSCQPPSLDSLRRTTITSTSHHHLSEGSATFITNIESMPINHLQYKKWLHYKVTSTDDVTELIQSIRDGTAVIVTDGSYFEEWHTGSAAWTIESFSGAQHITGISVTPGPPSIVNSHRSELVGTLAALEMLSEVCEMFDITTGSVLLGCDCINALRQAMVNSRITNVTSKWKHSDITSAVVQVIKRLPIKINPRHIKGHQDDHNTFDNLSRLEQLNVRMDYLAKQAIRKSPELFQQFREFVHHPLSFRPVSIKNITFHDNIFNRLYDSITADAADEYWKAKNRFDETTAPLIDWTSLEKAMKLSSLTRRRFVVKWATGNFGTGVNLVRWKQRVQGNCPHCLHPDENKHHILLCQHATVSELWTHQLWKYAESLYKYKTSSSTLIAIRRELMHWRCNTPLPDTTSYSPSLKKAIMSQRQLGWEQFLEGLISKHWISHQQEYFDSINSSLSTSIWASRLIRQGWELIYQIWQSRNNQLHNTDRINDFNGLQQLKTAIRSEWSVGLNALPASDFSYLFKTPLPQLLQKSLECLKDWLAIIRSGRYLHNDSKTPQDAFNTDPALRHWIGLPPL